MTPAKQYWPQREKVLKKYTKTGRYGQHIDVTLMQDEYGDKYRILTNQDGEETVEEGEE